MQTLLWSRLFLPAAVLLSACAGSPRTSDDPPRAVLPPRSVPPRSAALAAPTTQRPALALADAPRVERLPGNLLRLDYGVYSLWVDCGRRGPLRFEYTLSITPKIATWRSGVRTDPHIPGHCQPRSLADFDQGYARMWLLPPGLDQAGTGASAFVTDTVPAKEPLRRGVWRALQLLSQCPEPRRPLHVIGGVYWGNVARNDVFLASHGQPTPDAFWLVLQRGDDEIAAWFLPNHADVTVDTIDDYLTTVDAVEQILGQAIPVDARLKRRKPASTWPIPAHCGGAALALHPSSDRASSLARPPAALAIPAAR